VYARSTTITTVAPHIETLFSKAEIDGVLRITSTVT